MTVSHETILNGIDALTSIDNVLMDANSLAEDVMLLSESFEEMEFKKAISETVRALIQIAANEITSAHLKYSFAGWDSYHFQHTRAQGARADMRIIFKEKDKKIYVLGFGHRDVPADIYARLAQDRL